MLRRLIFFSEQLLTPHSACLFQDVIEEIYASKSKFDRKCSESQLPRETVEQHLYTYLNQKYGLKPLILEWAQAVIAGAVPLFRDWRGKPLVLGAWVLENQRDAVACVMVSGHRISSLLLNNGVRME